MSEKPFDPNPTHRNFYGRRHGKTLRRSQKGYLAEDLGALQPAGITLQDNPGRTPIEPGAIFGDDRPIWLEIGFGGGEHMVHMAATYPEYRDNAARVKLVDVSASGYYGKGYQDVQHRVPGIANTTADLGWTPKVTMDDVLGQIFEAYRQEIASAGRLVESE